MHVEQDTEAHDVDETSPLFPKRNAHPQQVDVLLIAPPMCDFCTLANPTWCYPAKDFIMLQAHEARDNNTHVSVGSWAACNACHDLIEAGNKSALATRFVETLPRATRRSAAIRKRMLTEVEKLQLDFWDHRCGPAERFPS